MFNKRTNIKARVIAIVNQKIDDAQKELDLEIRALEAKLKTDKEVLIETHVEKILNKIL